MLTDLLEDQRKKLMQPLEDQAKYINPEIVTAIATLGILDVLCDLKKSLLNE